MAKESVTLPIGTLNFPNLFEARLNDMNGKMEFGSDVIFSPGANLTEVKDVIHRLARKLDPDYQKAHDEDPEKFTLPLKPCKKDKKGRWPEGHREGGFWLKAKTSTTKPVVGEVVNGKFAAFTDKTKIYSGVQAVVSVVFSTYKKAGKMGVTCYLNNVCKVADAEPLTGRTAPEDDFAAVASAPTGGASTDSVFK